jgi:H+-transporting ATPase
VLYCISLPPPTTTTTTKAYCIVRETGPRTEIGRGQSDIVADRQTASISVFESKVLIVVKNIIGGAVMIAVVICLVQGIGRKEFDIGYSNPLLAALAILIAAVPVALPLVMQVTMAIGAANMASVHHAVVTRMSALQDIASMEVLCSDKTGTITTAKMTIFVEKGVSNTTSLQSFITEKKFEFFQEVIDEFQCNNRELMLMLATLGSNIAKVGDAIDSAVFRSFNELEARIGSGAHPLKDLMDVNFEKVEQTGFNPEYKRTVTVLKQKSDGKKLIIAKGLLSKILDTSSGGQDSAPRQWRCVECDDTQLFQSINEIDEKLAQKGYKTIAVAMGEEGGPMKFIGILPM